MSLITVDQEKCIKCGICVKECPTGLLRIGEKGPEELANGNCMACGHCVAACPKEAIDNKKTPLVKQIKPKEFPKLNAEEAENFLRSRRSIRSYKEISVPREKLIQLVDIARFAPTASNKQGVSYVIVDDRKVMEQAVEIAVNWLENDATFSKIFSGVIKNYHEKGIDTVLRGAPNLILATTDVNFSGGRENSIFSLTYLELFAPSLGLGSCWAGIFEICALSENSPMLKLLNIPEDKKITGAVMVGYPQYSYKRLVDRNPLDATFYKNIK
ncbi:MAG: nitroreductase family protein [Clostridium sp.]|uniref:nitroreductase family protein n=1 Tax=Clostridium sp. TaxID=1506 RepID=UPI0039EBAE29